MDNEGYVLSTVLGAWVLSVGVLVTAAPAHDNTPDRNRSTEDSMAAYRATHPDAHSGVPVAAHLPQRGKSHHAPPPIARTAGDQPRISIPAGK